MNSGSPGKKTLALVLALLCAQQAVAAPRKGAARSGKHGRSKAPVESPATTDPVSDSPAPPAETAPPAAAPTPTADKPPPVADKAATAPGPAAAAKPAAPAPTPAAAPVKAAVKEKKALRLRVTIADDKHAPQAAVAALQPPVAAPGNVPPLLGVLVGVGVQDVQPGRPHQPQPLAGIVAPARRHLHSLGQCTP